MTTPTRYVRGTALALVGALLVYVRAIWVGHLYDLRAADEFCTGKALASSRPLEWTMFPPTQRCRWSDGTTSDLVPWYLNMLLFGLLGLAVLLVAVAIRTRSRRAKSSTESRSTHQ